MVNRRTRLTRRTQIINCLVEGNSIRWSRSEPAAPSSRMNKCFTCPATDSMRSNLVICEGEAGSYQARHYRTKIGDQWTFVAIDPDTKLVPSYLVEADPPERH
jgi:hypothetical protein